MTLSMERPITPTDRLCFLANSKIMFTRCTEEAKVVTSKRPFAWEKTRSRFGKTDRSEGVKPGTSELVESLIKHRTPFSPWSANRCRSNCSPSTGVWSTLKSPVWIITPSGVWIATEKLSAIEWVLRIYSTKNDEPTRTISRGCTVRSSVRSATPASSSLSWSRDIARRGP